MQWEHKGAIIVQVTASIIPLSKYPGYGEHEEPFKNLFADALQFVHTLVDEQVKQV